MRIRVDEKLNLFGGELFAGALGGVAVVVLALAAGLLAGLMAVPAAGYVAAPAVLVLLGTLKFSAQRRAGRGAAAAEEEGR